MDRITISLPKDMLDRLHQEAMQRGLSRASYIRMVLTDHITKQADDRERADQGE